jgi:tripartite-type tricarboxylate transporter receptor subunit TctC
MHLAAERLFRRLDIRMTMVPFQGAAQTLAAFTGGHIDLYGGSVAPITPTARAGNARCLLVTSRDAHPDLTTAASLTQLGVPEEETLIWFGMVAPRGVPAERRARLLEAFRAAHATERFQNQVRSQGANPAWVGPEQMGTQLRTELEALGAVARALNIRVR